MNILALANKTGMCVNIPSSHWDLNYPNTLTIRLQSIYFYLSYYYKSSVPTYATFVDTSRSIVVNAISERPVNNPNMGPQNQQTQNKQTSFLLCLFIAVPSSFLETWHRPLLRVTSSHSFSALSRWFPDPVPSLHAWADPAAKTWPFGASRYIGRQCSVVSVGIFLSSEPDVIHPYSQIACQNVTIFKWTTPFANSCWPLFAAVKPHFSIVYMIKVKSPFLRPK